MVVDDQRVDPAELEGQPARPRRSARFDARDLAVIWRHKVEVALAALLFATAAVAIGRSLTPKYTAAAQLYVDPSELQPVDREPAPRPQDASGLEMVVESQLRLLTSNSVLAQVIQDLHLDEDPEFAGEAARDVAPMAALEALRRHITATKPDRSFVVNIEVWSNDPAKAALLANTISNDYLAELKRSRAVAARRSTAFLSDRLKELQARIQTAETALAASQVRDNPLNAPGALTGEKQLATDGQQLTAAHAATLDAQARYDQIEAIRRDGGEFDALPEALQSPTVANLRSQYAKARRRYAELAGEFGPLHPSLRQLESHIEELRRSIKEEVERLALSAKEDLTRARDYEASLNQAVETQKRQIAQLSQPSPKFRELQGNVEASRDVYQSFLKHWRESGEHKSLNTISARVIGEATTTGRRTFPPAMWVLAGIGFMLGALAASAWFVEAERRLPATGEPPPIAPETSTVVSPSIQPPQAEPEPQETMIPSIEKPLIARLQEAEVVRAQSSVLVTGALPDLTRIGWPTLRTLVPAQTFLKSIGEMHAAVIRRPAAGAIPVLAVIGAGASEDRSIAALNIALAAARGGARVLLIDADYATRGLTKQLLGPGKTRAGRFSWLPRASAAIETVNGVSVLPVSRGSDAKASDAICKLIAQIRSFGGYDLVILDGPATPSSAADRRLLDVADGLVADLPMNLDVNDCVRDIIAALGDVEPKLIGFVLNELQRTAAETRPDKQLA